MLREKSCGIIPFREVDGEIRYLVISSAVTRREHWEFPKGGVEEGEREIETALRELWEETGVRKVRVLPGYREPIRYIYRRPEGLVSKQVVYFVARVEDPTVKLREVEAKDYRWANYEEARKLLRHANARALLERCHAFITGKPLPPAARPAAGRPNPAGADGAQQEGTQRNGGRRSGRRQRRPQREGGVQAARSQQRRAEIRAAGAPEADRTGTAGPAAPGRGGRQAGAPSADPNERKLREGTAKARRRRRRRGGRRGGQQPPLSKEPT